MRASRAVIVGALCAVILGVGYAAAPEPLPALELVTPASTATTPSEEALP